jgi:hypothetical protein
MATKTKPKAWKHKGRLAEEVLPNLGGRIPKPKPSIPKSVCNRIIKEHLSELSKSDKKKAAEGIDFAVHKFLVAANVDARPLPENIRAQAEGLEKAARVLLNELENCDDFTWSIIAEKAETTPPAPAPKPTPRKRYLLNYLLVPLKNEPMDRPDRIVNQLRQYAVSISEIAKNAEAFGRPRTRTAFPILVWELMSVWMIATGEDGKSNPKFTDFVKAVAGTDPVRKVVPPVGDQRRKIQRTIIKVSS